LRQPSEINQRHPFTTVWVDRWSGQIKEVRNPATFSTGETMLEWLWPLHTGEALGTLGRFVWFLAGLSVCFLYVTGVMHWLYRHGKIKDRTVDISTLRPLAERAEQGFYRFAVALLTVSILAGRWAMPHLKTGYTLLLQWVKRGVAKLRK
jgi:uncharacterized iron-regulated membrane protein